MTKGRHYCALGFVLTGLFWVGSNPARAQQIVLTYEDMIGQFERQLTLHEHQIVKDSLQNFSGALQTIANTSGEDVTWDFRDIPFDMSQTAVIERVTTPVPGSEDPDLTAAPLIKRYNGLTVEEEDSTVYSFYDHDTTSVYWLGLYYASGLEDLSQGFVEEGELAFDSALVELKLPLQYGLTWTDSTYAQADLESTVIFIDVDAEVTVLDTTWVEGWGTLITPIGTQPALKVRKKRTENWAISVSGILNLDLKRDNSKISFITDSDLSAWINLDGSGNVTGAAYVINPTTVAVDEPDELPNSVVLEQNYPNPFNPQTEISFTLPTSSHISLVIFDVLGKQIDTIVEGVQPAGKHTFTWDAGEVPSGVYLYRLETPLGFSTRTMVLVK